MEESNIPVSIAEDGTYYIDAPTSATEGQYVLVAHQNSSNNANMNGVYQRVRATALGNLKEAVDLNTEINLSILQGYRVFITVPGVVTLYYEAILDIGNDLQFLLTLLPLGLVMPLVVEPGISFDRIRTEHDEIHHLILENTELRQAAGLPTPGFLPVCHCRN